MNKNQIIAQEYLEGVPIAQIARQNQIGTRRVYQILDAEGIQRVRGATRKQQPLSKLHQKIGQKLYDFWFDMGVERKDAANRLGWSTVKLRCVEIGEVDLTLFDLQDIAGYMNEDIGTLLNS